MSFLSFKKFTYFLMAFFLVLSLCSCSSTTAAPQKLKDLEFTVVEISMIPEEQMKMIELKKTQPFTLTYTLDGYIYIAQGYGTKPSGGYSIVVRELYQSENCICFKSELIGPGKTETVIQSETHPYIVVKTADIGLNVVFQ